MVLIDDEVFEAFGLDRNPKPVRFGNGLINDTYRVRINGGDGLLQRINHHVFKDVPALMNNLKRVSQHVALHYPSETFVSLFKTRQGADYAVCKGNYWRVQKFIPDTHSFDSLTQAGQAYEAGRVIGRFHFLLSALDGSQLADTIPNFHDLDFRASQFQKALEEDIAGRADQCLEEIELMQEILSEVSGVKGTTGLPQRVVHNDTKINNVLFDKNEKGVCMVDLDTVMRGTILFDTGDALRTLCNPSGEDGTLAPVGFYEEAYIRFITGYLSRTKDLLTKQELSLIPFSMLRMSAEQCVRFLTDHLQGDLYYFQPFAGFNLRAVQVQQEFIRLIRINRDRMEDRWAGLLAGRSS